MIWKYRYTSSGVIICRQQWSNIYTAMSYRYFSSHQGKTVPLERWLNSQEWLILFQKVFFSIPISGASQPPLFPAQENQISSSGHWMHYKHVLYIHIGKYVHTNKKFKKTVNVIFILYMLFIAFKANKLRNSSEQKKHNAKFIQESLGCL